MYEPITPISIVIPVGPKLHHRQWLSDALRSVAEQSRLPGEIVIVDDGGEEWLEYADVHAMLDTGHNRRAARRINVTIHRNPCNLGVVASLNIGVAVSFYDLVLLGCADDQFLPNCVELCWQAWEQYQEPLGYYYLGVRYSTGEEQNTACGAAMVTKALWRYTGGFPPQAAVGAADHIFLNGLLIAGKSGKHPVRILRVSDDITYWYRQHSGTETRNNIWSAIEAVKVWWGDKWL